MPNFTYKAIDADGGISRGETQARNLNDLEARLKRMGLDLVSGRPRQRRIFPGQRLPRRELITFCFHLEQLTNAGIPINDALIGLRDSHREGPLRNIVADLVEAITNGHSLSEAMTRHPQAFDDVVVSLIRAGESSGRLPEVLHSLIDSLQWQDECLSHMRRVLLYPTFVGGIIIAATLFLMIHLVPQLKQFALAMGQPLALPTRLLFHASDILIGYWPILLILPVLGIAGLLVLLQVSPTARRHLDACKLRLPVIGTILNKLLLARFANLFALLYASGIPILDTLRHTQTAAGNCVIDTALRRAEQRIAEGRNLSQAFGETGLFPQLVIRMLHTGEHCGRLDDALLKVALFYGRDVRESVGKVQALIEPVMTLFLGILLGWIMLAVLGPVYDFIGAIDR